MSSDNWQRGINRNLLVYRNKVNPNLRITRRPDSSVFVIRLGNDEIGHALDLDQAFRKAKSLVETGAPR